MTQEGIPMNHKKNTIRLCALSLSAVMLLGLFGCNKQEEPSKAEEKAQQITAEHIDRFVHGTCLCKAS